MAEKAKQSGQSFDDMLALQTPIDYEAEQAVLGSVLQDNDALRLVRGALLPEHFFMPAHRIVFTAMLELEREKKPVDPITLAARLRFAGKLDSVAGRIVDYTGASAEHYEGVVFLAALEDAAPLGLNVRHYAEQVYDRWRERQIVDGAREIVEGHGNAAITLTFTERLKELRASSFHEESLSLKEGLTRLGNALVTGGAEDYYLRTHSPIDKYVTGLRPGFPFIVAARTGEGKTTFAAQTALRNAVARVPTLYVTLEMKNQEIVNLMASNRAAVDSTKIAYTRQDVTENDWDKLSDAFGEISEAPLWAVGDGQRRTIDWIHAEVAKQHAATGLKLVVVDHLRKVKPARPSSIYDAQTAAMDGLGDIAKEFDVVMLICAQINREGVDEPKLNHLEGSGAIEQDAHTAILLWAPWEQGNNGGRYQRKDVLCCRVAKCRNGKTGMLKLRWQPEFGRIGELSEDSLFDVGGR